jgi:hypothetical protein
MDARRGARQGLRRSLGSALGLGAALLALACSGGPTDTEGEVADLIAPPPTPEGLGESPPPPVVGPDGELLESDERVLGLVLPRGLEARAAYDLRHVYTTDQPLDLVLRYFGTRLVTGVVERSGLEATYRNAIPAGIDAASAVHMDVVIGPTSGASARIEIIELPAPLLAEPSEEEVRARIEEYLREHPE